MPGQYRLMCVIFAISFAAFSGGRAAGGEQHLPERFPQVDSKHKKRDPLSQAPSIQTV